MKARLRLALDHNFPRPIIDVVMKLVPEADLLPLQTFDDGGMLATLPDWKLLVALHRKPDVHGLPLVGRDASAHGRRRACGEHAIVGDVEPVADADEARNRPSGGLDAPGLARSVGASIA